MYIYEENEKAVNKAIKNCLNESTWVQQRINNKLKALSHKIGSK